MKRKGMEIEWKENKPLSRVKGIDGEVNKEEETIKVENNKSRIIY